MTATAVADDQPIFWVLPLREAPAALRRAPGTVAIIVMSFLAVGLGAIWPSVRRALEVTDAGLADGQLWRLVTYVLPHEGMWPHVIANMFLVALFGWQLEKLIGTTRLLAVYFACGALGMVVCAQFNPIDATSGLRAGASLAVFGSVTATLACVVTWHGIRAVAVPWIVGTCVALELLAGVTGLDGNQRVDAGLDGFVLSVVCHSHGLLAGLVVGAIVARTTAPGRRT